MIAYRVLISLALCSTLLAGCPQSRTDDAVPPSASLRICPDDTPLTLPAGFCATEFATDVGSARHLVVRANGDVYVALRGADGGIVALRDRDGDGVADQRARFGTTGGTGIAIRGDYLYFATPVSVVRYRFDGDALRPERAPELVVGGFNEQPAHASKTIVFDDDNGLIVNVGAPSNACQKPQRSKGVPGQDPCPELAEHAGLWRFDADRIGQDAYSDGVRYASGIRNALANDWHPAVGKLYAMQHGRDQLSELWPETFTQAQRVELPAEEFLGIERGDDFGWPYCYYDPFKRLKVLAPEYGGDGSRVGRCARFKDPIVAFPAHWAPNDLLIYTGRQFPARYRHGAFVAFHGSWNRAPEPQRGYNVAFVPLRDGRVVNADEPYTIFADGFAGAEDIRGPGQARHRPTGLAQAPDGRLFISDSTRGDIWRIEYVTPAESGAVP